MKKYTADRVVNFEDLRKPIKGEYTDCGAKMIADWVKAQARMTSKKA